MQNFEHKRAGNRIKPNKKMGNSCAKAPDTNPLGEALLQASGGGTISTVLSRAAATPGTIASERFTQMIGAIEELVTEMDNLKSRMTVLEGGVPPKVKSKVKSDQSWIKDEQAAASSNSSSDNSSDSGSAKIAEPKEEEVIQVPMTPTKPPVVQPEIHAMSIAQPYVNPVVTLQKGAPIPEGFKEGVRSVPYGPSYEPGARIKVVTEVEPGKVTLSEPKELSVLTNLIESIPGDYNVSYVTQTDGDYNVIPVIGKKKIYCVSSISKTPGGDRKVLKLFNAKRKPAKVLKLYQVCSDLVNYADHEVESDISNLDTVESQGLNALVDLIRNQINEISLSHIG